MDDIGISIVINNREKCNLFCVQIWNWKNNNLSLIIELVLLGLIYYKVYYKL